MKLPIPLLETQDKAELLLVRVGVFAQDIGRRLPFSGFLLIGAIHPSATRQLSTIRLDWIETRQD